MKIKKRKNCLNKKWKKWKVKKGKSVDSGRELFVR